LIGLVDSINPSINRNGPSKLGWWRFAIILPNEPR
jgi:hypothetical protein